MSARRVTSEHNEQETPKNPGEYAFLSERTSQNMRAQTQQPTDSGDRTLEQQHPQDQTYKVISIPRCDAAKLSRGHL